MVVGMLVVVNLDDVRIGFPGVTLWVTVTGGNDVFTSEMKIEIE